MSPQAPSTRPALLQSGRGTTSVEPHTEASRESGPGFFQRLRELLAYPDTRALVILFFITQVLDAATTAYALNTRRFQEGNPWLDETVAVHPYVTYFLKLGIATVVVLALLLLRLKWRLRLYVLFLFTVTSLIAPLTNMLKVTGHL